MCICGFNTFLKIGEKISTFKKVKPHEQTIDKRGNIRNQ
jgi:hypothetical protein